MSGDGSKIGAYMLDSPHFKSGATENRTMSRE